MNLDIIIVSYGQDEFVLNAIRGFEYFLPKGFSNNYIIVENKLVSTLKEKLNYGQNNINFVHNCEADSLPGSEANAHGIEAGKRFLQNQYAFVCHADIFITSEYFYNQAITKFSEGVTLIGLRIDPGRVKAYHISGIFVESDFLSKVNTYPKLPEKDTGDNLTIEALKQDKLTYLYRNTFNDSSLIPLCNPPFNSIPAESGLDRTLDDNNEVFFIHLGRGVPTYHKKFFFFKNTKLGKLEFLKLCNNLTKK